MLIFEIGDGVAVQPTSLTWLHPTQPLRTKSALTASQLRAFLTVLPSVRSMFLPSVLTRSTVPVSVRFALYHDTYETRLT